MDRCSFTRTVHVEDFSRRERQVLRLIGLGMSTKEAAEYLGISYKTADGYRRRVMHKLGVHNVVHATHCAIRLGLVRYEELCANLIFYLNEKPKGDQPSCLK